MEGILMWCRSAAVANATATVGVVRLDRSVTAWGRYVGGWCG